MTEPTEHPPPTERVQLAAVIMLGLAVVAMVVGLTIAAVQTDRDLWRGALLAFAATVLLASIGGVSWWAIRRHRWRVSVDRDRGSNGSA
jgi:protein-S-isoprenylcysteine O-methyltransferase Ste14